MADITLNIERALGYESKGVSKKIHRTITKAKISWQTQFAIAFCLFAGGVIGAIALVLYLMIQEGVFLY
ncbi:MAG: hypothetical protein RR742_25180 [Citrobacter sp.]|uniref:hypothetical protein n=1 Tax=Citrobacter sp. TaxID=1896336 RepID=UPI002FC6650D